MNASELRIGNWIDYNRLDKIVRTQFNYDLVNYIRFFNPIPITAEILEKSGFKECGQFDNYSIVFYEIPDKVEIQFSNIDTDHAFVYYQKREDADNKAVYFKYLHQLQNLYFALTGEELQITL